MKLKSIPGWPLFTQECRDRQIPGSQEGATGLKNMFNLYQSLTCF